MHELGVTPTAMKALTKEFTSVDHTGVGILEPAEFRSALKAAQLDVSAERFDALTKGLANTAGLVELKTFKSLLLSPPPPPPAAAAAPAPPTPELPPANVGGDDGSSAVAAAARRAGPPPVAANFESWPPEALAQRMGKRIESKIATLVAADAAHSVSAGGRIKRGGEDGDGAAAMPHTRRMMPLDDQPKYWFGGSVPSEAKAAAAAGWRPEGDGSHLIPPPSLMHPKYGFQPYTTYFTGDNVSLDDTSRAAILAQQMAMTGMTGGGASLYSGSVGGGGGPALQKTGPLLTRQQAAHTHMFSTRQRHQGMAAPLPPGAGGVPMFGAAAATRRVVDSGVRLAAAARARERQEILSQVHSLR